MTTATGSTGSTGTRSGEYTHRQILTILSGLMMGMFLAALDQTIVATAIRTIADDLDGLSMQAWVTTAYLITSTVATPIYGKIGDLFGRKKLFLFAITIFVIGSAACSFATSMYMLAAFRAFQGIGAGGLFTLALAIIGDLVSPRERAKYTGYFMATFATSSVLGPVVGGLFAQAPSILGITGWRWVFLVNVPIGIVALFVVQATLHLHTVRRSARIDWWGATALMIGLTPLLIVAEQGQSWGWGSGRAVLCYVIGGVALAAFVVIEARLGSAALIPLRIFRIRAAAVTIAASVIIGMSMFGAMMILPQYMQIVHGASPMKSGFMMLPMVLGMMSAAMVSGLITSRTGRIRGFPILGSAVATGAMFLLATITADTALWIVMLYMLLLGLGLGNCMQPLMLIVQNAVPPQSIGVATSSATFFRQMGGTIGVAAFISLLFSTVGGNIRAAFRSAAQDPAFLQAMQDPQVLADPVNRDVVHSLQQHAQHGGGIFAQVQSDSSVIDRMSPVLAHPFKVGFAESMSSVFLWAGAAAALAFVVLLFMPHVELRAQSAAVAAREQEAARAADEPRD
ncbi:MAG TPA: MDR family MFS transporter [Marmoricola sp.]|nr:MDR family MFS transporter [Marmoricola sp.]